jgi:opacity protein-like surface antigen
MNCRTFVLTAAALLATAGPALAQDSPISVNVGGGFTTPYSDLKDAFGVGGNFQLGVNFRVTPMIKLQAEYGYNRLGSKDLPATASTLPSGTTYTSSIPLTANHTMNDLDFNAIIGPALGDKVAVPYGIVGAGVYHQNVNVTSPAVGVGTACDPWLFICYPVAVPVTQIVGQRSNTSFGFNLGGGVTFKVTDTARFYAEFRYIHTNGPTFTLPSGSSQTANGNYFPITFGFRLFSQS